MDNIKTIDQYTKLKYQEDTEKIKKQLVALEKYIKNSDDILKKKKEELEQLKKQAETLEKLKKFINL